MRIRTDGDYEYREDAIEQASEFYDRNKTDSVVRACEDIPALAGGIRDVLEREDLTHQQRMELSETLSTRYIRYKIEMVDGELKAKIVLE